MSFSQNAKAELSRVFPPSIQGLICELCGIIYYAGDNGQIEDGFSIAVGSAAIARKAYTMVKKLVDLTVTIMVRNKIRLQQGRTYIVAVKRQPGYDRLLDFLPASEEALAEVITAGGPSEMAAFLRGSFLACGSITNPEKNYHLEMVCQRQGQAEMLVQAAKACNVDFRVSHRKGVPVVYVKEGEQIVHFLNMAGANNALLTLENIRVWKELRNQVNRRVNCETANMDKTVKAAMEQIRAIKLLADTIGLSKLPKSLQGVARLRLDYPYASLKELGTLLDPPISKSAVNHRMRRIEKLAKELTNTKGAEGLDT